MDTKYEQVLYNTDMNLLYLGLTSGLSRMVRTMANGAESSEVSQMYLVIMNTLCKGLESFRVT